MSDLSKMGRHELEAELHKWRTGRQLGGMQEDLNAMQARAVEAEARVAVLSGVIDRVMALLVGMSAQWRANAANHRKAGDIYVHCADELESTLKGKPCE